jgi:hypothetical protein
MLRSRIVLVSLLILAGCADSGSGLDLYHGTWGQDGVRPPPGLTQAESSEMLGRTISTSDGASLPVKSVLQDATGHQRYVLVPDPRSEDLIVVPVSALAVTPDGMRLTGGQKDLVWLQHHPADIVERLYPRQTAKGADKDPLAGSPLAVPMIHISTVTPVPESLAIMHDSRVVGLPVVDSDGASAGTVDALAVVPWTGQVLYGLITGPQYGPDGYIFVPVTGFHLADGRVVALNMTAAELAQLRHYNHHDDPLDMTGAVPMN